MLKSLQRMSEAGQNGDWDFFLDASNGIDLAEIGQHMTCHDAKVVEMWVDGDAGDAIMAGLFPSGELPECDDHPRMSDEFMHFLHENYNDTMEVSIKHSDFSKHAYNQ